jgi:diacylglycerol kinase (ATP)
MIKEQLNKNNSGTGANHLIQALGWSISGFGSALKHETAFRQEILLCLVLVPLAFWLGDNGIERAFLIGSLLLVLVVELLNTAVESVVDRVGQEHHPLSGRAKDLGSAAVFISLLNVICVWSLILLG